MKRILLTVLGFLLVTITFGQSKLNIINQTSGATIYLSASANPKIGDTCSSALLVS